MSEVAVQEVTEEQVVEAGLEKIGVLAEQITAVKRQIEQLEAEKETTETFVTGLVKQKNPQPIVFKGKKFFQWALSSGKVLTINQKVRHSTKYAEALKKV